MLAEADAWGVCTYRKIDATIVLARCRSCDHRPRVLPCDVLPRKTYSVPAIDLPMVAYARGDRGLRRVAWSIPGERTPSHTTIHAWSEGIGAWALGRAAGEVAGAAPCSAVLAETRARFPAVAAACEQTPSINPDRYRSEARRERLSALCVLIAAVLCIAGADRDRPLTFWRQLALGFGLWSAVGFRTGLLHTPIERVVSQTADAGAPVPSTGGSSCTTVRTRSPPGASSRSRRSSTPPSTAPHDGA